MDLPSAIARALVLDGVVPCVVGCLDFLDQYQVDHLSVLWHQHTGPVLAETWWIGRFPAPEYSDLDSEC